MSHNRFDHMSLFTDFCGNSSSNFWDVDHFGFCMTEVVLHLPLSVFWLILSIVYTFKASRSIAFEWPFSKSMLFRITFDAAVIFKTVIILFIGLASFYGSSEKPPVFYSAHLGSTMICFLAVALLDFLHSKANWKTSRGPKAILVIETLYFYTAAIQMWSGLRQFSLNSTGFLLLSVIFDVVFTAFRLITKVPITNPTENERRRNARLLRQGDPNNLVDLVDATDGYDVHVQSESSASCCGKLFFTWINNTINKGFYGELFTSNSLPSLSRALTATSLASILIITGPVTVSKSGFKAALPIVKALFKSFSREFAILSCMKFTFSLLSLSSPIFLNRFISELTEFSGNWKPAAFWGAAIVFSRLLTMFLGIAYDYWTPRFGFKMKVSITSLVYRQILKHKSSTLSELSTGNLVNLLTSDTERIINLAPSLNELWAMPVQVAVSIILLYLQIGVSCIVGVAFLVVLVPLNRYIAGRIGTYSASLMHHKDFRVKV